MSIETVLKYDIFNTQTDKVQLANAHPPIQLGGVLAKPSLLEKLHSSRNVLLIDFVGAKSRSIAVNEPRHWNSLLASVIEQVVPWNLGHVVVVQLPGGVLGDVSREKLLYLGFSKAKKLNGQLSKGVVISQCATDDPLDAEAEVLLGPLLSVQSRIRTCTGEIHRSIYPEEIVVRIFFPIVRVRAPVDVAGVKGWLLLLLL